MATALEKIQLDLDQADQEYARLKKEVARLKGKQNGMLAELKKQKLYAKDKVAQLTQRYQELLSTRSAS